MHPGNLPPEPLEEDPVKTVSPVDKLWIALGKAIRANASTRQVKGIADRLNNLRRNA
jgi:hypothetical protein